MSPPERKRCFECGVSYPPDVNTCEEDHVPLWSDTVHEVWKIEGVLSARPGGATCAAYHLHSGARVAIDLVRGAPAPDPAALKILTQELQALRLLEHPNTLRLVEEGIDRAPQRSVPPSLSVRKSGGPPGIRITGKPAGPAEPEMVIHYLVTDLGSARPLSDLLEDSQRQGPAEADSAAGPVSLSPSAISQVGRQLLSVLSAAHRLGLAHGTLSMAQIFVADEEDSVAGLSRTGAVRLHGLRALGLGPLLREAINADLSAVGAILFELATGQPPPAGAEKSGTVLKMPVELDHKLAQVILRGVGANGEFHYGSADEMLRALVVAAPPAAAEVSSSALAALTRTDPQANRPSSGTETRALRQSVDSGIGAPPALPRISGPHNVLPAPPSPFGSNPGIEMPMRSRLSGELRQVSFRKLLEQEEAPQGEETLARSRRRISASSLKIPALPSRPFPGEEDELDRAARPASAQKSTAGISSGEHASLEPTADLSVLPVDFASGISGPVSIGSSLRDGKSDISLPPQPALPPQAMLPPPKAPPATLSPKPAEPIKPAEKPASAALKGLPELAIPVVLQDKKLDPEIDPLAKTGQAMIPSDVLAASRRMQHQAPAQAPKAPPPAPSAPGLSKAPPAQPPVSKPAPPPPPDTSAGPQVRQKTVTAAAKPRPLLPWLILAAVVLGGLIGLLILR